MKYRLKNGKDINIPDEEIRNNMKGLDLTEQEAIEVWLEDNEYEINEEQEQLHAKAKTVKINHEAKAERKERKPVERKPDEAKEEIIANLAKAVIAMNGASAVKIVNTGKLITFELDGDTYKIDLIRQRKPKGGK